MHEQHAEEKRIREGTLVFDVPRDREYVRSTHEIQEKLSVYITNPTSCTSVAIRYTELTRVIP